MTLAVIPRRIAIGGAVLLSGCLLLAACGGPSNTSASSAPAMGAPVHAPPEPQALKVATGAAGGSSGPQAAVQTAGLAPQSQSIIYTASLTIRSGNVAAAAKRAIAIAVAAGGYTADEQMVSGSPGRPGGGTVSLTLKVPVPSYQAALAQLSSPALGKQLTMQQQATDVTQQVADVNSLVTSEQDAIAALRGLLKKAASVSGLLQVQEQISQDQSTLNSLLSQQRALDHETSYATVNVTLVSPKHAAAAHKTARHGFLAGLAAGWRALKHATEWVLTALGVALPFLIIVVLLGGIGYLGWRRLGGRRAVPPQPQPAEPAG
jgi:hypothetical protein